RLGNSVTVDQRGSLLGHPVDDTRSPGRVQQSAAQPHPLRIILLADLRPAWKQPPRKREPHALLLGRVVVLQVPIAADMAEPEIVQRPRAAARQRYDVLDRRRAARVGMLAVEDHRMAAAPAIVPVALADLG